MKLSAASLSSHTSSSLPGNKTDRAPLGGADTLRSVPLHMFFAPRIKKRKKKNKTGKFSYVKASQSMALISTFQFKCSESFRTNSFDELSPSPRTPNPQEKREHIVFSTQCSRKSRSYLEHTRQSHPTEAIACAENLLKKKNIYRMAKALLLNSPEKSSLRLLQSNSRLRLR